MKLVNLRQLAVTVAGAAGMMLGATGAFAAGSVSWTSPADGSSFLVGTVVHPEGNASGFGTGGTGLDLALVLDASGSMAINQTVAGVTKSRSAWQAEAAVALVNSLPSTNTSVAVAQFTSSGFLRLGLTSTTNKDPINAAINAVPASGGTTIGTGINVATTEITANSTAGRSKQMVVISDGDSFGDPVAAAAAAKAAGIIVHGVVIPGGNATQMQSIATAGTGTFIDAQTEQGVTDLISLFSGFGGSLVGVDRVKVELPDGSIINNALTDAFGNFKVPAPGYALGLGSNVFTATAYFSDGSTKSDQLTLTGTAPGAVIPLPAAAWLLLSGLGGLGLVGRARRKG